MNRQPPASGFGAMHQALRQVAFRAGSNRPGAVSADLFYEHVDTFSHSILEEDERDARRTFRSGTGWRVIDGERIRAGHRAGVPEGWEQPGGWVDLSSQTSEIVRAADVAWSVLHATPHLMRCSVRVQRVSRRTAVVNTEGQQGCLEQQVQGILGRVIVRGRDRVHEIHRHYDLGGLNGPDLMTQVQHWARGLAEDALVRREAVPSPSGEMPVILGPGNPAGIIHEACGHGLEGDHVCRGLSVYAGLIGQRVASPLVTVVDDPTMSGLLGSYLTDDEGTPAARTVLIEDGILRGFLHDRLSAAQLGVSPTGHGRRTDYRFTPQPRMSNTFVLPGNVDFGEMLASTKRGLFVTSLADGNTDPVSGNFQIAADEAFLIEDGKVTAPVYGAVLQGNGPVALRAIDGVANRLQMGFWIDGGCIKRESQPLPVTFGQPAMRVSQLKVKGGLS